MSVCSVLCTLCSVLSAMCATMAARPACCCQPQTRLQLESCSRNLAPTRRRPHSRAPSALSSQPSASDPKDRPLAPSARTPPTRAPRPHLSAAHQPLSPGHTPTSLVRVTLHCLMSNVQPPLSTLQVPRKAVHWNRMTRIECAHFRRQLLAQLWPASCHSATSARLANQANVRRPLSTGRGVSLGGVRARLCAALINLAKQQSARQAPAESISSSFPLGFVCATHSLLATLSACQSRSQSQSGAHLPPSANDVAKLNARA